MAHKNSSGKAQNPQEHPQQSFPERITVKIETDSIRELGNAVAEKKDHKGKKEQEMTSIAERQANAQERANRISGRAFGANVTYVAATLFIIWLNVRALNSASQATKAADTSADAATKAANYADTTVQESRKQFELDNRPFVVLDRSNLILYINGPRQPPKLKMTFTNYGKFPARPLGMIVYIHYAAFGKEGDTIITHLDSAIAYKRFYPVQNDIIPPGAERPVSADGDEVHGINDFDYKAIMSRFYCAYIGVNLKYRNEVTGAIYMFEAVYKLTVRPEPTCRIMSITEYSLVEGKFVTVDK